LFKTKPKTSAQLFAKAVSTNDINYIFLKRRNDKGGMPPLSLKRVFCIFAMLDKFLGGDGLSEVKPEFWKADDTTDEELQKDYAAQITTDEILDEIVASTDSIQENRREKWTIIVFSETFFSSDPWDDAEVEKVKKCCRLLTDKHKTLVICVNFLHKYRGVFGTPSRQKPIEKEFVATTDEYKAILTQNALSNFRFSNHSMIVWNGVQISCYRKTTYNEEGEEPKEEIDVVRQGYGYDFGDWRSYPARQLTEASDDHKKFAELFNTGTNQIIASRICSDMNHTPDLSKSIKLLILQADDAPLREFWIPKVHNAIVCYCDAGRNICAVIKPVDKVTSAEKENVSPFIWNELRCTVALYFVGCKDEICCCC
jgi:hypothetical protein